MCAGVKERLDFVVRPQPVWLDIVLASIRRTGVRVITPMGSAQVAPSAKMGCVWMKPAKAAAISVLKVHFATVRDNALSTRVNPFIPTGFVKTRL